MTADEAKQALKQGKKVKVKYWNENEFVREEKYIVDEHGILQNGVFQDFKDDYWEIVE